MTADPAHDEYFDGRSVLSSKPIPKSTIEIQQEPCLRLRVASYDSVDEVKGKGMVHVARFLASFTPPYTCPLDPAKAQSEGIDLRLPLDRQDYVDAPQSRSYFTALYVAEIKVVLQVGPFPNQIEGVVIHNQYIQIRHYSYPQFRRALSEVARSYGITAWLNLPPYRQSWLGRLLQW